MMLSDIKKYLIKHKSGSLYELSQYFNVTPDIMRDMLAIWVRKDQVTCFTKESICKQCNKCDPIQFEMYAWKEKAQTINLIAL